jgi:hypothetical protein
MIRTEIFLKNKFFIRKTNMSKPILVYVSKEDCGACEKFETPLQSRKTPRSYEWSKIKRAIGDDRAVFVNFHVNPKKQEFIPSVLTGKEYYYPMILLLAPNSYARCFTLDGKVNEATWDDSYRIKGFRYNAVEDRGVFTPLGRATDAPHVIAWFEKMAPQIPAIDETVGQTNVVPRTQLATQSVYSPNFGPYPVVTTWSSWGPYPDQPVNSSVSNQPLPRVKESTSQYRPNSEPVRKQVRFELPPP